MGNISLPVTAHAKKILLIILGCALALHILSDVGVYAFRPQSISTTPDPLDYRLAALNILHYGEFSLAPPSFHAPQLLRTPAYPFILAGTYMLDGDSGLAMIILQSFMLVAMGWLLFKLLIAFRVQEEIALVLVALYLLEPFQWFYTLLTMTETTASLIMLALITSTLVGNGINNWSRAALYGIGIGLAILVKPSVEMWAPFLLLLVLFSFGTWRARFIHIGIVILMMFATLSPWIIRNYELTGSPIVSSSGEFNLILFAGTPATVPVAYWNVVTMASYNGHTNKIWYAYTTGAYPMLVTTEHAVLLHANYLSLATQQISCAPTVWFGNLYKQDQEAYGHEYGLIAGFVLGPSTTRDRFLFVIDIIIWTLILILSVIGTFLLVRDSSTRWRFLPLLGMLFVTVFINYCASWVRMVLPLYSVICIATGVGVTFIMHKIFATKAS
jgi:4-amino-4-deoxy-L-arabinose transferase-like glycosyltransferase